MNKLTAINQYDLVLVCGAYKTGTSLATHLLEQKGYYNPATINNQHEHGNGLSQRYMTKECSTARKINNDILYCSGNPYFANVLSLSNQRSNFRYAHFNSIHKFILELPPNTVLKDPQFTYSLYYWLEVFQSLNKKIKVIFTHRPNDDLIIAWNEAYFTKSLLIKNKSSLINMTMMTGFHQEICNKMNIPFEVFELNELKIANNLNIKSFEL